MENETELISVDANDIKRRIFTIRGKQVMLDSDLAELYQVETKNLNKHLIERLQNDPSFVANLLLNMYPRKHGDTNTFTDEEIKKADFLHNVFLHVHFCPCDNNGKVDEEELDKWCETFLKIMKQNDMYDIGMLYLGKFLSNSPSYENDTVWPLPSVCKVIEKYYTEKLGNSFLVETLNNKGIHLLNVGKNKKKTAEKYDSYLQKLEYRYPYTSKILRDIRDAYLKDSDFERSWAEHEYQ